LQSFAFLLQIFMYRGGGAPTVRFAPVVAWVKTGPVVDNYSNNWRILCSDVLLTVRAASTCIWFPSCGESGCRGNKNVTTKSEHCIKWSTGLGENSSGKSNNPLERIK
jgi:hypothetical protein